MKIKKTFVEAGQENSRIAQRLGEQGFKLQKKSKMPMVSEYRAGKENLTITGKRGDSMGLCASMADEYLCCNVNVLASVSNCPSDCSYCFLQNYLTDASLSEVGDTAAMIDEVREKTALTPHKLYRIGAWELGDPLALEPITGGASDLVEKFAALPNALLELKTKSGNVDSLLDLNHGGRTILSWSLNPQAVIEQDEIKTASLHDRLDAMKRGLQAGYPVALHFDPMILYDGWQQGYADLVEKVAEVATPDRVAWISIGSLRFNPEMKKSIEENFPKSRITSAEMVLGPDGKVRYVKPLRIQMYRLLVDALHRHYGSGDDAPYTYLCMERRDMWQKILPAPTPASTGDVDSLITDSLYRRFPGYYA